MVTLINTIEISPLQYLEEEYELPDISDYPDPDEWFMKWEEAASKLSLNFNMIQKGSYLVDIEAIDDGDLQIILEAKLNDIELKNPGEAGFVLAFDGGVVLKKDNEILIQPNCCADMSDIKNWQSIFNNQLSVWTEMWIGHPWVLYKRENGKISFSDYRESDINEYENIKVIVEVDESELKTELEKAIQHQINFRNRISEILKKMNVENAERISQQLTGASKS